MKKTKNTVLIYLFFALSLSSAICTTRQAEQDHNWMKYSPNIDEYKRLMGNIETMKRIEERNKH